MKYRKIFPETKTKDKQYINLKEVGRVTAKKRKKKHLKKPGILYDKPESCFPLQANRDDKKSAFYNFPKRINLHALKYFFKKKRKKKRLIIKIRV